MSNAEDKRSNFGLALFYLMMIFLIIKLVVVSIEQLSMYQTLKETGNLTAYHFLNRLLIIEPVIILISIAGFLIKGRKGFLMSLIFVYFVIAYAIYHYIFGMVFFRSFHIGQLNWALVTAVGINIPKAVHIFSPTIDFSRQWKSNAVALVIGMILNIILITVGQYS